VREGVHLAEAFLVSFPTSQEVDGSATDGTPLTGGRVPG
jgi:hypothetical protein